MQKNIPKIHFITNHLSKNSHINQVTRFISTDTDGWVQYRPKNSSLQYIENEGLEISKLCTQNNVTLIMNDHVEIAKSIDADGVHLGKSDMKPSEARKILGDKKIIGGTANTYNDIEYLISEGVDYIGLGPYKFTTTKSNLSPILGLNGYNDIVKLMKKNDFEIPILAIGGIDIDDISKLMETGIHGVAISSIISESQNIYELVKSIQNRVSPITIY